MVKILLCCISKYFCKIYYIINESMFYFYEYIKINNVIKLGKYNRMI